MNNIVNDIVNLIPERIESSSSLASKSGPCLLGLKDNKIIIKKWRNKE